MQPLVSAREGHIHPFFVAKGSGGRRWEVSFGFLERSVRSETHTYTHAHARKKARTRAHTHTQTHTQTHTHLKKETLRLKIKIKRRRKGIIKRNLEEKKKGALA